MMRKFIIGIGGMTNGGKTTLSKSLMFNLPNCSLIEQDKYFKDDSLVPVDKTGLKLYDTLGALYMDKMMNDIDVWNNDPAAFLKKRGGPLKSTSSSDVFVLLVEGFLIFNYWPLAKMFDKKYFLEIPYDVCKERRSQRTYVPPDAPGYFDAEVWPMYLKNRQEMEAISKDIIYLDGSKPKDLVLAEVCDDITKAIKKYTDSVAAAAAAAAKAAAEAEAAAAKAAAATEAVQQTIDKASDQESEAEEDTQDTTDTQME